MEAMYKLLSEWEILEAAALGESVQPNIFVNFTYMKFSGSEIKYCSKCLYKGRRSNLNFPDGNFAFHVLYSIQFELIYECGIGLSIQFQSLECGDPIFSNIFNWRDNHSVTYYRYTFWRIRWSHGKDHSMVYYSTLLMYKCYTNLILRPCYIVETWNVIIPDLLFFLEVTLLWAFVD